MFFRKKKSSRIVITIPEPCDEKWAAMKKVDDCHRHCAACDRILTDFAGMDDNELLLFFKHSQGKICGRFRIDQLNRPLQPIPEKTTKAQWWKAVMLLPFTFFSKSSSAQQLQPDSAQTEQEPYIVQTSDPITEVGFNLPDTLVKWNWDETQIIGPPEVTGGVPMVIEWGIMVPPVCYYTLPIDTIPHAEVSVGLQPGTSTSATMIPGRAAASGFGKKFEGVSKRDDSE
jgi:hypothetical protein